MCCDHSPQYVIIVTVVPVMWQVLDSHGEVRHLDGRLVERLGVLFLGRDDRLREQDDCNDCCNVKEDDEDAKTVLLEVLFVVERVRDLG